MYYNNCQTYNHLSCLQIAKPCGELLAEAMLHHMNKRHWLELDTEEVYAKQVCESDQIGKSQDEEMFQKRTIAAIDSRIRNDRIETILKNVSFSFRGTVLKLNFPHADFVVISIAQLLR